MLNLAPRREIEPGRFTIIVSCSERGDEIKAPTQFLLPIPRRARRPPLILGEVALNFAQPEVRIEGAPPSTPPPPPRIRMQNARARDRRLLATKTHTEKENRRGGRGARKEGTEGRNAASWDGWLLTHVTTDISSRFCCKSRAQRRRRERGREGMDAIFNRRRRRR